MNAYAAAHEYINTEKGRKNLTDEILEGIKCVDRHPCGNMVCDVDYYPCQNIISGGFMPKGTIMDWDEECITLAKIEWFDSTEDVDDQVDIDGLVDKCDGIVAHIIQLAKEEAIAYKESEEYISELDNWRIARDYIDLDIERDLPIEMDEILSKMKSELEDEIIQIIYDNLLEGYMNEVMENIEENETDDEECEEE